MAYTVSANLCNGSDYVACWDGGTFEDMDEAIRFFEGWQPPKDEVREALREGVETGDDPDDYDLQIGVWDEKGNDVRFWSEGLRHEREA